jgi:DNA replication protein DnaC
VPTTNKPFKQWASIFNNDSTGASAVLDRLRHYAETVVIEVSIFRIKDQVPARINPITNAGAFPSLRCSAQ